MRRKITAAVATAALAMGCTPNQEPRMTEDEARIAVAGRYASCAITNVEHHPTPPPQDLHDQHPRHTLTISLDLKDTKDAQRALRQYKDDDSVFWQPGRVWAGVSQEDTHPSPMQGFGVSQYPTANFGSSTKMNPTMSLYPRADYPTGSGMEIWARSEARSSDADHLITSTGAVYCGRLVLQAAEEGGEAH